MDPLAASTHAASSISFTHAILSTSFMDMRIRKRANITVHGAGETPVSKRRVARVRDGILCNDQRTEIAIEDCEPPNAQDAYKIYEVVVCSRP